MRVRDLAIYFGFNKLQRLYQDIQNHGGPIKAFHKFRRFDDLKRGRLVGQDKYGNKYYENAYYFVGRSRWVEYAEYKNCAMDASQVPPEWNGWLSYRTDAPPYADPIKMYAKYKWMLDHSENLSGTKHAYMPYSTTKPKIEAWVPKKTSDK